MNLSHSTQQHQSRRASIATTGLIAHPPVRVPRRRTAIPARHVNVPERQARHTLQQFVFPFPLPMPPELPPAVTLPPTSNTAARN